MPSKRRPRPSDQNGGEDSAEAEKDAKRLIAADIKAVEVGNSYDGLRAVLQAEVRAMPRATHGTIHAASEEINSRRTHAVRRGSRGSCSLV